MEMIQKTALEVIAYVKRYVLGHFLLEPGNTIRKSHQPNLVAC
jgi:hypothetical protein